MNARHHPQAWLQATVAMAAFTALGGCASLGGNVKGSFSCAAPDGICAPSSSIDNRALAMIAGDNAADPTPAGPYMDAKPRPKTLRTAAPGQPLPMGQADPRRTQERVLRIVFQPYIDGQGRLHEASAVHAVVQSGEWQQQVLASATPIPDRNARAAPPTQVSLAEAVDQADPANAEVTVSDPNLPDPAVVAAARARAADPVGAIKSEVAARLAPKATPRVRGTDNVPVQNATAAAAVPALSPRTGVGAKAAARVKASPQYQASVRQPEETARGAAAAASLPESKPIVTGTVRAAGFPAAVPEEH